MTDITFGPVEFILQRKILDVHRKSLQGLSYFIFRLLSTHAQKPCVLFRAKYYRECREKVHFFLVKYFALLLR